MKTSVGKTKLELANGDITELEVDAIVVPASAELWMDHGVAAAVKRAGGEAVEKEAVLQGPVNSAKPSSPRATTSRPAGSSTSRSRTPGPATDAGAVTAATSAALAAAERAHARSVAIPAFGTGACAFPLYQCASLMVGEVVAYLREHPRTALRHVMLSVYDDAARAAFKNAMAGISRI